MPSLKKSRLSGRRKNIGCGDLAVVVYPNVIYIEQAGEQILALLPEEWGKLVEFVGIRGLAPVEFPPESDEPGSGPNGY